MLVFGTHVCTGVLLFSAGVRADMCWYWVHVCARVLVFSARVRAVVSWYRCTCMGEHGFWFDAMMYVCEDVAHTC